VILSYLVAVAYAGIPLTHRDYAQSAIFVTGHLKEESDEMDWSTLARGNQTLVIYMGLSDLSKEAQAPSLIVVGEVVRLSQKLDWFLSSTDFNKSAIANSI